MIGLVATNGSFWATIFSIISAVPLPLCFAELIAKFVSFYVIKVFVLSAVLPSWWASASLSVINVSVLVFESPA